MDAAPNKPYPEYSPERIKHMEMVQAVVARLGGNGFLIKGWAITIVAAFQGFSITRENAWLALAALVPAILFWFLDASFLRSERAFRMLFEQVRLGNAELFFMNATSRAYIEGLPECDRESLAWRRIILRQSLALFYGALFATAIGIALFIALLMNEPSN